MQKRHDITADGVHSIAILSRDDELVQRLSLFVAQMGVTWRRTELSSGPALVKTCDANASDCELFRVLVAHSMNELLMEKMLRSSEIVILDFSLVDLAEIPEALISVLAVRNDAKVVCLLPKKSVISDLSISDRVCMLDSSSSFAELTVAISCAMVSLVHDWANRTRPLCLRRNGSIYVVEPKDILYVESHARSLSIHVCNGMERPSRTIDFSTTLDKFVRLLPSWFVQCHKSFLVNLHFVAQYTDDQIILNNSEHVPVSQRRRAHVVQRLCDYGRYVAA